jgi:hypothetical protein
LLAARRINEHGFGGCRIAQRPLVGDQVVGHLSGVLSQPWLRWECGRHG